MGSREQVLMESHANASGPTGDEDEENKIYYGFGVFMGLPLADLKVMRDNYLREHAAHLITPESNDGANEMGDYDQDDTNQLTSSSTYQTSYPRLQENGEREANASTPTTQYTSDTSRGASSVLGRRRRDEDTVQGRYSTAQRQRDDHSDGTDESDGSGNSHSIHFILH